MKDSEIHNNLENKEIRDFLSKTMVDSYHKHHNNKKNFEFSPDKNNLGQIIERLKIDIYNSNSELKYLETFKAITNIANSNGWTEYDVSDFVSKEHSDMMYRNFFGTEEEYKHFMLINDFHE